MTIDIPTATIAAALGFLVSKAYEYFKNRKEKEEKTLEENLKKTAEALAANTISITELKIEIKHLSEKLIPIPKIMQDVSAAHEAIRNLKAEKAKSLNGKPR